MKPELLDRNDALQIRLIGARDALAGGAEAVRALVDILGAHGMAPDAIPDGKNPSRPFSLDAMIAAAANRRPTGGVSLSVLRHADVPAEISVVAMAPPRPVQFVFEVVTPLDAYADVGRARAIVDLVKAIAAVMQPLYGYAHSRADVVLGDDPQKIELLPPYRVSEPYWLNIYGATMVDELGRDRVMTTPATRVDALTGGAVVIQLGETPANFASPEARRLQAQAMAHLRGVTVADELRRLTARSKQLAPTAKQWRPDVEELFERLATGAGVSERQVEIARLNALVVGEVTEWREAKDALPADVDLDAAREQYEIYAEQFVALLHPMLPAVSTNDPALLPAIDHQMWRSDFAKHAEPKDVQNALVPSIGGYLGQLLVDRLGGAWVPRRKLDETQVIIGNRVWLPFARARAYVKSHDAILTHSLTQFFHAAQQQR